MKKTIRLVAVLLICLLVTGMTGMEITQTWATDKEDIDEAQNEADAIQEKVDDLQSQLKDLSADISDTKKYVAELDAMLSDLSEQLTAYQAQIDAKNAEIDAKNQEIADKEAEIEKNQEALTKAQEEQQTEYEAMKSRIQYMYECGEETFLDMIFSSNDLSDLLGNTEYVQSITEYDRQQLQILADTAEKIHTLLATLDTDKQQLDDQKTTLETQKSELVALQTDLQNQQTYVDTVLVQKNSALTDLENQETYTAEQKAYAEQQLAEQEQMVADMEAQWKAEQEAINNSGGNADNAAEDKLEEIGLSGGFTWPLPGYNTITSEFGMRLHPILNVNMLHDGMDISGASVYGKPIVAAYSGTIIYSGYNATYSGYGNYVQIDHGSGVVTLYAHMSATAVSVGDTVTAGQTIGYVGSTGNSTGAHLHFSIYIKGTAVNPRDYITIPN